MTKPSLNKFAIIALVVILLFGFNLLAATKAKTVQNPPRGLFIENNFRFEIFAGRHIPVGELEIWSDQGYIYVRYRTFDNWYLTETHLHLAMDWQQIPQNRNGNPIPGHFAHQMKHNYVNEYTYKIPLNSWGGFPGYGAAHCVVVKIVNGKPVQEETGWARNKVPPYGAFPGHNWAWYFELRN